MGRKEQEESKPEGVTRAAHGDVINKAATETGDPHTLTLSHSHSHILLLRRVVESSTNYSVGWLTPGQASFLVREPRPSLAILSWSGRMPLDGPEAGVFPLGWRTLACE